MIPCILNPERSLTRAVQDRPRPLLGRLWWVPAVGAVIYLAFAAEFAIERRWFLCGATVILAALFLLVAWRERETHNRLRRWEWQQRGRLIWPLDALAETDERDQVAREIARAVDALDRELTAGQRARQFGAIGN
jgi:hypothetical protein